MTGLTHTHIRCTCLPVRMHVVVIIISLFAPYDKYHFTHSKIPVLMVLIIEACDVIQLLHERLKSEILSFSIIFRVFNCTWAQKYP